MISYLQAENVSKRIGDQLLFENISLNINKDDKIALIAVNGAGKSSLLDILAGNEQPDSGSLSIRRGLRISYLPQSPILKDENRIIDELFSAEGEVTSAIKEYERSLSEGTSEELQHAIQRMDDLKAWDFEVAVRQILYRLKLTDLGARIGVLSGGQKKRVALAKVLVEDSDLLILDEPTNHLDLDMIEWLEEYLIKMNSTLLMVTHDRYFLDRACTVILELSEGELFRYEGNYSYFLEKKESRETSAKISAEKARNLFRSELDWMRRMPKARRHKAKSRIDAFHDLKEKAGRHYDDKTVNININASRLGKKILVIKNVSKAFGEQVILENFSYTFNRFEKAGLVGRNGTGKTTFLNIITGETQADTGITEKGETIVFGYYHQQGIDFDEDTTVLDAAKNISETVTVSEGSVLSVSQFLNYFLFPPDKQFTPIRKLSGGEKRRLYLLTVLMKNPNFLILDEPTNDLDILTLNVLEEYLAGFRGCVIVVSHDRYFMDKVVDHIFEFRGDGIIKDFPGNYTQLRDHLDEEEALLQRQQVNEKNKTKTLASEENQGATKEKKQTLTFREKKEMELIATELDKLLEEKKLLEDAMNSGTCSADELYSKSVRHGEIAGLIDEKELRWLELSEKGL